MKQKMLLLLDWKRFDTISRHCFSIFPELGNTRIEYLITVISSFHCTWRTLVLVWTTQHHSWDASASSWHQDVKNNVVLALVLIANFTEDARQFWDALATLWCYDVQKNVMLALVLTLWRHDVKIKPLLSQYFNNYKWYQNLGSIRICPRPVWLFQPSLVAIHLLVSENNADRQTNFSQILVWCNV